jgi:hypothetical protein
MLDRCGRVLKICSVAVGEGMPLTDITEFDRSFGSLVFARVEICSGDARCRDIERVYKTRDYTFEDETFNIVRDAGQDVFRIPIGFRYKFNLFSRFDTVYYKIFQVSFDALFRKSSSDLSLNKEAMFGAYFSFYGTSTLGRIQVCNCLTASGNVLWKVGLGASNGTNLLT